MFKNIICVMLATFIAFGCENTTTTNSDTYKKELENKWEQFVQYWENEDAQNLVAMYTVDGVNIPPDYKINTGREEIREFYNLLFANNKSSQYNHEIKSVQIEAKMAIEYGEFRVNWTRNDGSEWVFNARCITHWVYENEDWKIKMLLFNNPPEDQLN